MEELVKDKSGISGVNICACASLIVSENWKYTEMVEAPELIIWAPPRKEQKLWFFIGIFQQSFEWRRAAASRSHWTLCTYYHRDIWRDQNWTLDSLEFKAGIHEAQGHRQTMEDKHTVVASVKEKCEEILNGKENAEDISFVALFDGHSGVAAAQYSKHYLLRNIVECSVSKIYPLS